MIPVVFTYLLVPFPIIYTSKWPIFLHCLAQLVLSYFFGIMCAMISELPALNLERIVFSTDRKAALQPVELKDYDLQLKSNSAK